MAKAKVKKAEDRSLKAEAKVTTVKKPETAAPKKIHKSDTSLQDSPAEKPAAKAGKPADSFSVAKAGKRSAKAAKAAEEKEAKQERKTLSRTEKLQDKPKSSKKPPRSRLERRGKKYRLAAKQIETDKDYPLKDALGLAIKTSTTKFDATVELHINLAVDPKQADQNVRGTLVLPAGTGKTSRVAVLAEADAAGKAKTAGADITGVDEVFALLDKERLDFDVLITHPSLMGKLAKYARLLGPKGLMPNPKSGTVTADIEKAVKEAKAGRVEYRVDSTGIVHVGIGKVSFGADKLTENTRAIFTTLKTNKPASVKGALILRAYVTTSMGPSIPLSLSDV